MPPKHAPHFEKNDLISSNTIYMMIAVLVLLFGSGYALSKDTVWEKKEKKIETDPVIASWLPVIEDHLDPWRKTGISEALVNATFDYYGSNIIFQYINGSLSIYDPNRYCFCNNSVYGNRSLFSSHLRVCRQVESVLKRTVESFHLPDFELVFSLDDIPMWNIEHPIQDITNQTARLAGSQFMPGFGAIRCWTKAGLALPFLGSHEPWHIDTHDYLTSRLDGIGGDFASRQGKAVFRGGVKGCSHERNTQIDYVYARDFNWSRRDCGRYKLAEVARQNPEFVDYQFDYLTFQQQSKIYRYILVVEGFGGWADRLLPLLFSDMVVFNQNHPCDQWFEPLMQPYRHFIPVAHDFRDLPGTVVWANAHPRQVRQILHQAKQFAQQYLSSDGITRYVGTLLREYLSLLRYQPRARQGSVASRKIHDTREMDKICIS